MRLHTRKMWSTFSETSKLVLNKVFFKGFFFVLFAPSRDEQREIFEKRDKCWGKTKFLIKILYSKKTKQFIIVNYQTHFN